MQPGPYPTAPAYPAQYPARQPYEEEYAYGRRPLGIVLGIISIVCGLGVAGSTFLEWLPMVSGWDTMTAARQVSNIFYSTQEGAIFFTGFFALALGALIAIGGLVMIFSRRFGSILTLIFSLCATALGAINIIMIYTKLSGFGITINPGIGIFLAAGLSLAALVLSIVRLAAGD